MKYKTNKKICKAFINACKNNHEHIIRQLYHTGKITQEALSTGVQNCVNVGNIDIVHWIWQNEENNSPYIVYDNGRIKIHKYNSVIFNTNLIEINDVDIINACAKGNLNTVKWLYKLYCRNDLYNRPRTVLHEIIFTAAAINNHLHILKWFKNINYIYVFSHYRNTVIGCCRRGHINIVKWCLDNKPNYEYETDIDEFIEVCIANKHWSLAIYIMTQFETLIASLYKQILQFVHKRAKRILRSMMMRRRQRRVLTFQLIAC